MGLASEKPFRPSIESLLGLLLERKYLSRLTKPTLPSLLTE
jgi:hypothetical protein